MSSVELSTSSGFSYHFHCPFNRFWLSVPRLFNRDGLSQRIDCLFRHSILFLCIKRFVSHLSRIVFMMKVLYQCEKCLQYEPLENMYYCQTCQKLLCSSISCILSAIDYYYCPICFDTLTTTELKQYGYRWGWVFEWWKQMFLLFPVSYV